MAIKERFPVGKNSERGVEIEIEGPPLAKTFSWSPAEGSVVYQHGELYRQPGGRFMVHIEQTRLWGLGRNERRDQVVAGMTLRELRVRFPDLLAEGARRYGLGGRLRGPGHG